MPLSRAIAPKAAFELLVTGDFLSPEEALGLGLINQVVAPEDLGPATDALAAKIAGKYGHAIALGKRAFYQQLAMPLDQAYAHTAEVISDNMMDKGTEAGIGAFLAKKKPEWDQ